ncbi:MAG TPA: FKBP-type peptidyl-prolyl cis-trans isomerase [Luteimonas sp.]|nr:FKBP-type peptidyl-prolyl cis-trans isomerase [Luteimonas sp.]
MKVWMRGAAAAVLAAVAVSAIAQKVEAPLATEREKVSYTIGMDVGRSVAPAVPDMDVKSFERAVRNAFDGGKPLLQEAEIRPLAEALMKRIAARNPNSPNKPAGAPPEVSREKVGLLVGTDVGRSLTPIKDEIELPVLTRGLLAVANKQTPLLTEAEAKAVRDGFTQRIQAKMQAQAATLGAKNESDGAAFLAKNKTVKGVFTTPSGLQYMVLRQGSGVRPKPSDRVRVNYHGTLLDGTVFDSSYDRGQPAEFGLNQVIAGWTEGVTLMPVGAKYRFWIPGNLAYGAKGSGDKIGPNATLVFDVELMAIL